MGLEMASWDIKTWLGCLGYLFINIFLLISTESERYSKIDGADAALGVSLNRNASARNSENSQVLESLGPGLQTAGPVQLHKYSCWTHSETAVNML